jgi:hypothetical protein
MPLLIRSAKIGYLLKRMGSVITKKIKIFSIREERKRTRRRVDRFFIGSQIGVQIPFQGANQFILPDEQLFGESFGQHPGIRIEKIERKYLRISSAQPLPS